MKHKDSIMHRMVELYFMYAYTIRGEKLQSMKHGVLTWSKSPNPPALCVLPEAYRPLRIKIWYIEGIKCSATALMNLLKPIHISYHA